MQHNLAVLIDFENIAAGTEKEGLGRFDVDSLMARVKDKGRILVSRSYADWGRFARFKQSLLQANVTMMELTSHGMQDKNRADIAMVVDCLELAFTRDYVDTFIIVSGDSDFTPLVLKMRELNKRVIGIGTRGSTSRLLINACDEFIFYDSIVRSRQRTAQKARRGRLPRGRSEVLRYLVEALEGMQREDPTPPSASVVKSAITRRRPDFNENDLGFSSFAKYLEAARDAGLVSLSRDKKSGGYRVSPVEDADDVPTPASNSSRSSRDGRGRSSSAAYEDPYFPSGSEALVQAMAGARLAPLAAPTRMTVLEAFTESIEERKKRNRRITIPFVTEDVRRRLRRTHPDLPTRMIKDLLACLIPARLLIHRDGSPIRNLNAPFTSTKDAETLNMKLTEYVLTQLKGAGFALDDTAMLAEFFLGNRDRVRDMGQMLAWVAMEQTAEEDEAVTEAETLALDALDDFLEVEGSEEEPAAPAADPLGDDLFLEEAPAPAPEAKEEDLIDLDDLLSVDEEPAAEAAPEAPAVEEAPAAPEAAPAIEAEEPKPKAKARKPRRKKAPAKEEAPAEEATEAPSEAAEAPAEEPAPEKPKRRTRRKKAEPKPEAEEAPAAEEKPKRRTRRKKVEVAKEEAPAADALDSLLEIE